MVFVTKNGLRSDIISKKFSWWERAPVPLAIDSRVSIIYPLADACYARTECVHAVPM